MDCKMRIALLGPYEANPENTVGGAHVDTLNLAQGLKKKDNIEIHVVTLSTSIQGDRKVEEGKLTVHYIKSPKLPRIATSLTIDQYKVLKKVWELEPDLVHAQSTAPLYGFTASFLSRRYPTLLRVHGIVSEEAKTWSGLAGYIKGMIYKRMEKYAISRIKDIVVDTDYVKEKLIHLCKGNIYVIPVAVDDGYFEVSGSEVKDRLLFVGGIEPRKGLIHLLKAVEIVRNRVPGVSLHIVGRIRKQKYFNEITRYIMEKKLSGNVKYLGELSKEDLKREYGECSIFVLPSQEESQGVVLLEAMAAGKPVVASNRGGIPCIVDDGKTGFLTEYGNPEKLAARILMLLGDDSLRKRMGEEGREKAKQFSQEKTTESICDVYRRIIEHGR